MSAELTAAASKVEGPGHEKHTVNHEMFESQGASGWRSLLDNFSEQDQFSFCLCFWHLVSQFSAIPWASFCHHTCFIFPILRPKRP